MSKTIFKIIIFFIFISTLFASEDLERLKENGFFNAANTLLVSKQISKKNKKNDLNEVEKLFKSGENSWQNSKYAKLDFTLPKAQDIYYFTLIDSVINYMRRTNQLYLSIPYLKKGMDVSYDYVFFDKYMQYACTLNELYLKLGLFNKSWQHLKTVQETMDDLYLYENFEDAKSSFEVLSSHFLQFKLKMDTVIASKNFSLLSYEELTKEFNNLQKAYKLHPNLEFFDFRYTTSQNMIQTKGLNEKELEKNHYYLNIYLLRNFFKLFSFYEDSNTSILILNMLENNYLANIGFKDSAKSVVEQIIMNKMMFSGPFDGWTTPFDGTREKLEASYLRFPLQNELWIHTNKIELYLLKNKNKKAFSELQDTQNILNTLLNNYKKLEPYYKDIDNIDKEIYQFNMIKATVLEKNNMLNDAKQIYKKLIAKNEEVREYIPLNMRKNFFNGFGKNAYLGLIRVNTLLYQDNPSKENFNHILKSINNIQARQLKELTEHFKHTKISLNQLQNSLSSSELIYILFDVDDAIAVASISSTKESAKLFIKPKGFDRLLSKVKDQLIYEYIYNFRKMKEISLELFKPLEKYQNISTLHILSDGSISILPFDIYLDTKNNMLFKNYTIDYLSMLEVTPKQNTIQQNTTTFLGIADPYYNDKDSKHNLSEYFVSLPETRIEVEKISTFFQNKKLLFGKNANESKLKSMDLKKYNFIHFATHGILGGELKETNDPSLVLSSEGNEDGFLTTSEVVKLKLNANLTVLSACNTGSGKYFRGEGLSGIGRAFKIAGSKNLVVSLWPVDSMATQKLMNLFYKNIASGENYTDALHNAKLTLQKSAYTQNDTKRGLKLKTTNNINNNLDGYKNPYFWSAFILIK